MLACPACLQNFPAAVVDAAAANPLDNAPTPIQIRHATVTFRALRYAAPPRCDGHLPPPAFLRASGVDTFFNEWGGGRGKRERRRGRIGAGGRSLENLHAIVVGVSHHDAPVAVDGNAALRAVELSIA